MIKIVLINLCTRKSRKWLENGMVKTNNFTRLDAKNQVKRLRHLNKKERTAEVLRNTQPHQCNVKFITPI